MNPTEYWNGVAGAYEIERSLRFNNDDSAYLTRTPSSAGNRETYTVSMWVKRSQLGQSRLFGCYGSASAYFECAFTTDDQLSWYYYSGGYAYQRRTNRVFRDVSAWYHFVFVLDTTNGTAEDRVRIYVNNERETSWFAKNDPTLGFDCLWNSTSTNVIGDLLYQGSPGSTFDGYMAEFHSIDGQALAPSDFGETNEDTGAWIPKEYSGSYGTNGFYLNFSDNSSVSALGTDSSGNGNNWTPNNFSVTAGVGNDSMEDTPTNNWSTLNPLDKSSQITLSQGNLSGTGGSQGGGDTFGQAASTIGLPTTGKYLFEIKRDAAGSDSNFFGIGISKCDRGGNRWPSTRGASGLVGYYSFEYGFNITHDISSNNVTYRNSGTILNTYSSSSTSTSAVYGLAIDCDASTATFYENGTAISGALSFVHPGSDAVVAFFKSDFQFTVNFGQRGFSYPISGFKALNTANLPEPTIKDGTDYFNTVLWTGNGSTSQTIPGVGFQSDFIWIKGRSIAAWHRLQNTVTGINKLLYSNSTASEATDEANGYVSSVTSDGFVLADPGANGGGVNGSGSTYVAWNWKESVDAGFDIVTDVGTGAAKTVSHNLGVAPKMIIRKSRTSSTGHWYVYHYEEGASKAGILQLTNSFAASTAWNSTAPTSSVFSVGSNVDENKLNDNYISYLFAEVEGYSKFGSYTGNGSANGPFVYCGFRPAMIILKKSSATENWAIYDSKRDSINPADKELWADSSSSEYDGNRYVDFLSNGFKLKANSGTGNLSGQDYIFMAFAETPFKYANAR